MGGGDPASRLGEPTSPLSTSQQGTSAGLVRREGEDLCFPVPSELCDCFNDRHTVVTGPENSRVGYRRCERKGFGSSAGHDLGTQRRHGHCEGPVGGPSGGLAGLREGGLRGHAVRDGGAAEGTRFLVLRVCGDGQT